VTGKSDAIGAQSATGSIGAYRPVGHRRGGKGIISETERRTGSSAKTVAMRGPSSWCYGNPVGAGSLAYRGLALGDDNGSGWLSGHWGPMRWPTKANWPNSENASLCHGGPGSQTAWRVDATQETEPFAVSGAHGPGRCYVTDRWPEGWL